MPLQSESGFQLEGSAPEAYETYLVPTLFAPCAQRLLEAVGVRAGARVVDVVCGTGIVGRQAGQLVGSSGTVTGVDLNPAMVEVAARLGPGIDWSGTPRRCRWMTGPSTCGTASRGSSSCRTGQRCSWRPAACSFPVAGSESPSGAAPLTTRRSTLRRRAGRDCRRRGGRKHAGSVRVLRP